MNIFLLKLMVFLFILSMYLVMHHRSFVKQSLNNQQNGIKRLMITIWRIKLLGSLGIYTPSSFQDILQANYNYLRTQRTFSRIENQAYFLPIEQNLFFIQIKIKTKTNLNNKNQKTLDISNRMNNTEYKLKTTEQSRKNSGRPCKAKFENKNENAISLGDELNIFNKTIADDYDAEQLVQQLAIQGVYQPPVITGVKASYFNGSKNLKEKRDYETLMKEFKQTVKSEGYKSFFFIKQHPPRLQYKDGQYIVVSRIKFFTQIFSIEYHQMKEKYNQEDYKQMCEKLNLAFLILDDGFAKSLEYLANDFYEIYWQKKQIQDFNDFEEQKQETKQEIIEHWKQLLTDSDKFKEINDWIMIKNHLSLQYQKIMSIVEKVLKAQNSDSPRFNKKESITKKQLKKQNLAVQKNVPDQQKTTDHHDDSNYQQNLLDIIYESFLSMINS